MRYGYHASGRWHRPFHFVMAGLVPAIHVFDETRKKDVDARHKAGHDESWAAAVGIRRTSLFAGICKRAGTWRPVSRENFPIRSGHISLD
jgi:hypothetical protein